MDSKFMVIDKVEEYVYDEKVVGRTLYDKGGNKQNIKKGQGGSLEKRWDELDAGVGRAIKLEMSEFKGHPFVSSFEWVEDKLVEEAQRKVESGIAPQEQGMWYKEIGEMYRAGIISNDTPEGKILITAYWARMFIALNIEAKGAKDVKETKEVSDKETRPESVATTIGGDDSGGGVKTAAELMKWAYGHGKEFNPSWVKKEALLGDGAITEEVAQIAYQTIKAKMDW